NVPPRRGPACKGRTPVERLLGGSTAARKQGPCRNAQTCAALWPRHAAPHRTNMTSAHFSRVSKCRGAHLQDVRVSGQALLDAVLFQSAHAVAHSGCAKVHRRGAMQNHLPQRGRYDEELEKTD